jgi:hypothetical protein
MQIATQKKFVHHFHDYGVEKGGKKKFSKDTNLKRFLKANSKTKHIFGRKI